MIFSISPPEPAYFQFQERKLWPGLISGAFSIVSQSDSLIGLGEIRESAFFGANEKKSGLSGRDHYDLYDQTKRIARNIFSTPCDVMKCDVTSCQDTRLSTIFQSNHVHTCTFLLVSILDWPKWHDVHRAPANFFYWVFARPIRRRVTIQTSSFSVLFADCAFSFNL